MKGIRILRRADIRTRTGHCDAHIDKLERDGKFPARHRISKRAVGWYEHEVDEYLLSLPLASDVRPDPAGDLASRGWDGPKARKRHQEKLAESEAAA